MARRKVTLSYRKVLHDGRTFWGAHLFADTSSRARHQFQSMCRSLPSEASRRHSIQP